MQRNQQTPWEFMGKPIELPHTKLPVKDLPKAQEFKDWDKRSCDCPMPMSLRKRHRALGRGSGIRICCMARALESYMELPEGTLYFWMEFKPDWEWKAEELVQDGEEWVERGDPPDWLKKRFQAKGITYA